MNFNALRDSDFQARLKGAKTAEELVALAKESGVELSDDQIEVLSGGQEWYECDRDECFDN